MKHGGTVWRLGLLPALWLRFANLTHKLKHVAAMTDVNLPES